MPKASPTKMVMPVTKKIHSERIHHALGYKTPDEVYKQNLQSDFQIVN